MAINKREFLEVAAKALGRPLPENLFIRLASCLAVERLTYEDLVEVKAVPRTHGLLEVRTVDCKIDSGTQFRILYISRSFEITHGGVEFKFNADHEWNRGSVLVFGDDDD